MKIYKLLFVLTLSTTSVLVCMGQKKKKSEMEKTTTTQSTSSSAGTLKTQMDTISYSLGVSIAQNIKSQGFEDLKVESFSKAFEDVFNKKPLLIDPAKADELLTTFFQSLQKVKLEKNIIEGKKFLDENGKKSGVITLPSGLQYIVVKEGSGPKPKATDKVKTHYHGMLLNGKVFDSSVDRGEPAVFGVNQVIPGWTEALQLMNVGSKWKLFIPSNLAYGERGAGGSIEPNSTLIFDVELLSIEKE